jgi:hypothetical protein
LALIAKTCSGLPTTRTGGLVAFEGWLWFAQALKLAAWKGRPLMAHVTLAGIVLRLSLLYACGKARTLAWPFSSERFTAVRPPGIDGFLPAIPRPALNKSNAGEIERAVAVLAQASNGGLMVTAGREQHLHRDLIITLAARRYGIRALSQWRSNLDR